MRNARIAIGAITIGLMGYSASADVPQPPMDHLTRIEPGGTTAGDLFGAASTALDPDGGRSEVTRSRSASLELGTLNAIDPDGETRFVLNLFEDARYEAVVTHSVVRGPRSYTVFGKLAGVAMADFQLVVERDAVLLRASDYENRRSFEVRQSGNGPAFIVEVGNHRPDECAVDSASAGEESLGERGHPRCESNVWQSEDVGDRIDVLVVYTAAAGSAQGGDAAMRGLGFQAMDDMNQRLSNSGLPQRVRVVATRLISYSESENASTDLTRLRGIADTFMDDVHSWRSEVKADVVVLIVNSLNAGGIARRPGGAGSPPGCDDGFAVVRRTAIGGGTFAHELGHTFGNCHSAQEGSCDDPMNNYCRGYRFTCGLIRWHTTMAGDAHDSLSTRIPYYSTDLAFYNCSAHGGGSSQTPVGSDTARAAQTIAESSAFVANNFHGDFNCFVSGASDQGQIGSRMFPYHTIGLAMADRWDGTTINISAGVYSEPGMYAKPGTLTAYDGFVLIR